MPPAASRRVTVRFGERAHRLVTDLAAREGLSLAQYVREAALMRAALDIGMETIEDRAAWTAELRKVRSLLELDDSSSG